MESLGADAIAPEHRNAAIEQMIARGIHSPWTTSAGRLYDAVAALTGAGARNDFEGQAPMALEAAIGSHRSDDAYPLPGGDWRPLIEGVAGDLRAGRAVPEIAARFHNALVQWIAAEAEEAGIGQVVLSGGVFQNGYLVERACVQLEARGFRVFTHHAVPANDGGIALGQLALAAEEGYDVSGSPR
jgi:hydrogenase maturation protein HypF